METKIKVKFQSILSEKKGFLGFSEVEFQDIDLLVRGWGVWKRADGKIMVRSPAKRLKNGRYMDYLVPSPKLEEEITKKIAEVVKEESEPTTEDLLDFLTTSEIENNKS